MALELPAPAEARQLLTRLYVPEEALDEIVAARPRPDDPELAALHHELVTSLAPTLWPLPAPSAPPLDRWRQLWAIVAALPHGFAVNAARGVPEAVTWETLRDLGINVRLFIQAYGKPGYNGAFWLSQHVRGQIYRLGRLSFNTWKVIFDPGPGAGFARDDPALGVHIPPVWATGPLTPAACDDSFAQAREFFPRHLPDQPFAVATCESWLLDPQLADGLPAGSNIVRFQRRFTIDPHWVDPGDEPILRFVFNQPSRPLEELPRTTRLERFIVDHLRAGGHFQVRAGWVRLQ